MSIGLGMLKVIVLYKTFVWFSIGDISAVYEEDIKRKPVSLLL